MLRSFKNRASSVFRKKKAVRTTTDLPITPESTTHDDDQVNYAPGTTPTLYPPPLPHLPLQTSLPSPALTQLETQPEEAEQQQQQENQPVDQTPGEEPATPDPPASDPFAPKYVPYIEATPLRNNMFAGNTSRYGPVNPDIMGGFGDDDDSIWLVDDEETDEEQHTKNQSLRQPSITDNQSRPETRQSESGSSSLHRQTTTQLQEPGPAPPPPLQPAFRYHVPSLLNDDDFTSGNTSSAIPTPETPATQDITPAPRRGYAPVAASIFDLTDLGVEHTDEPTPKPRDDAAPPDSRPPPTVAAAAASSSSVNPFSDDSPDVSPIPSMPPMPGAF